MLRLRQLTIRKYRDCEPCELKFGSGQVFLLGMNGGGKTTLVELLSRLASLDLGFFERVGDDIDLEWSTTLEKEGPSAIAFTWNLSITHREVPAEGPSILRGQRSSNTMDWTLSAQIEVSVEQDSVEAAPRATLSWKVSADGNGLVKVEPPAPALTHESTEGWNKIGSEQVLPSMVGLLSTTPGGGLEHAGLALLAFIFHAVAPTTKKLDEALLSFDDLTDQSRKEVALLRTRAAKLHWSVPVRVPHEAIRIVLGADAPVPIQLRTFKNLEHASPDTNLHVALREELNRALGGDVEIVPVLESEDADGTRTYSSFTFYVTWPDGSKQRHDALSFGQKRMISALWHIACTPDRPVFTDELSNGLHAAWITRLLELLGDQQAFHATQNPLLLDLAGPGPADQLASRFVRCEVALVEGKRRWRWRNPTADEAARINAGYEAGFQHLSDILQSEGLW